MKRGKAVIIISVFLMISLLSLSLVSASIFSDFWNKITGKVIAENNYVPSSASGYYGKYCYYNNAKIEDGNSAGLARVSGGSSTTIDNEEVSACIRADFESDKEFNKIKVKVQSVQSICGDSCSGDGCGVGGTVKVFYGSDGSSWKYAGQIDRTENLEWKEVSVQGSGRYVLVCRGDWGGQRDNNIVDAVKLALSTEVCDDTCPSLGYECGNQLVCGENVDCGSCSVGFECQEGRCVQEAVNVTCTDSDGGKNYYERGTIKICVSGQCIEDSDLCYDTTTLKEFYCENSNFAYEEYGCPNGCSNGACIEGTTTDGCSYLSDEVKATIKKIQDRGLDRIVLKEGKPVNETEYVVIPGYILRVADITNGTTGYSDDDVELRDALNSSKSYTATITAEGKGYVYISGKKYDLTYIADKNNNPSAAFYITLNWEPVNEINTFYCEVEVTEVDGCSYLSDEVKANANSILLKRTGYSLQLSVGGASPNPSDEIIDSLGKKYIVELISATDTSATIKITDALGNSESKEIIEDGSKFIMGLEVDVIQADESTATSSISADINVKERKMVLKEKDRVFKGEYLIIADSDYIGGYIMEVANIHNGTTGYSDDEITLRDALNSSKSYTATITAEGKGTITIGGRIYYLTYVADKNNYDSRYFYITLDSTSTPQGTVMTFYCDFDIATCEDSDGYLSLEESYYVKGNVMINNIISEDNCNPGPNTTENTLLEYYCTGNALEPSLGTKYECPNGCSNGACIGIGGTCNGCLYSGACLDYGFRVEINDVDSYCDFSMREFLPQKGDDGECQNGYECFSNECSAGICVNTYVNVVESASVITKIWCKVITLPIFGGTEEDYVQCLLRYS